MPALQGIESKLLKDFAKAKPIYWKMPTMSLTSPKMTAGWRAKPMHDPDKDGYPNAIDCSNLNPNKQGLGSFIKEKVEAYKANAPARKEQAEQRTQEQRQKAMEAAEYKTKMLQQMQQQENIRSSITQSKTQNQLQQIKVMEARQKSMGAMPNPFGGMGGGMGGVSYAKPMPMPKMSEVWNINPMNPMASLKPEQPKVKVVYRTKPRKKRKK